MRTACAHYCSTHVHSTRAHRAHRALVRVGHVLVHGQRVGSDTHNDVIKSYDHESVINDQHTIESYDQGHDQDTTIRCLHDQGIKASQGKAVTVRPRRVAGKEGGSE